jgi:hypothetical protein
MTEIKGNIWDFWNKGYWIAITTNVFVRANGKAVMGRGVALQAARRFPELPKRLGSRIQQYGNHVFSFTDYRLFTFPVKHFWFEKADLELIACSARELARDLDGRVYLPRPGCGNGQLDWNVVKPMLTGLLDDRFVIVEYDVEAL